MKLLFVQSDSLNPVINNAMHIYNFEPLGLYYLAASVKDNCDVDLIDLIAESTLSGLPDNQKNNPFLKKLTEYKPDIVAFSAFTPVRTGRIKELSSIVKNYNEFIITIVGGVHASLMPSDFDDKNIDIIIKTQPLENFRKAIYLIQQKKDIKTIEELVNSKIDDKKTHLDSWPQPYRELGSKYREYYQITIGQPGKNKIKEQISSVKTSSGCPFRCNFCCLWQLYPKYEIRNIDSVVSEIKSIDNEHIFFADDESMINARYMMELAEALGRLGIRKKYVMYSRADTIIKNPQLLEKWANTGLKQIWIGLEGTTNTQLERYEKNNTIDSQKKAINIVRSFGIDIHATALVDQTFRKEDFDYMLDYTKEDLQLTSCHFFILTPLRGTKYYYQLLKRNPEEFLTQNPDHFSIRQSVIQPLHMSIEEFHRNYTDLQKNFNSDTIPFEFHGTFKDESYKKEFEELKRKNDRLYETILTSHLSYPNKIKEYQNGSRK